MKKIYKLIFSELILNFFITYLAFFTIILSIDFLDKIDDLIVQKFNLYGIAKFFFLRTPFIHSQINLYATIISIMITLNIMAQKNETTALLSSGVNIKKIFNTFLIFAIFSAGFTFINDNFIYPKWSFKAENMLKKENLDTESKVSNLMFKTKEGFIFINLFIPEQNILFDTYIVKLNDTNTALHTVLFSKMTYRSGDVWKTKDGVLYNYTNHSAQKLNDVTLSEIDFFKNFGKFSFKKEWLGIRDILKIINSAKKSGVDITGYYYHLLDKIINVISFFLLFFIIFPFGFQLGRNKKNVEIIFVGILILLCFTVARTFVFKVFKTSGINPVIPLLVIAVPIIALGIINWKKNFS